MGAEVYWFAPFVITYWPESESNKVQNSLEAMTDDAGFGSTLYDYMSQANEVWAALEAKVLSASGYGSVGAAEESYFDTIAKFVTLQKQVKDKASAMRQLGREADFEHLADLGACAA